MTGVSSWVFTEKRPLPRSTETLLSSKATVSEVEKQTPRVSMLPTAPLVSPFSTAVERVISSASSVVTEGSEPLTSSLSEQAAVSSTPSIGRI